MTTEKTYQVKKLRALADSQLDLKAAKRSQFKPIKNWNLTYINRVDAKIGDSIEIEARDYIQALEHALYVAGFFLEKKSKKI